MTDPKRPDDGFSPQGAKDSLQKGLREVVRAARSAGEGIQREIRKGGIQKTVEDGGREVIRAATNVASFVGSELKDWGERAQRIVDPQGGDEGTSPPNQPPYTPPPYPTPPPPHGGVRVAPPPVALQSWPDSRAEFEQKYGKVAGDWPRSPEEFERRFGYPPKPVGPTAHDPGFRIVSDDDSK